MQIESKKNKTYINLIKIVACILVIINHTNSSIFTGGATRLPWFISCFLFFIAKAGAPLFMMASGALILSKDYNYKKVCKKVLKFSLILLIFSIFYKYINTLSHDNILVFLKELYNGQILNPLWYLYFYIILLIMSPILQKLVKNMTDTDFIIYFIFSFGIYGGLFLLVPKFFPSLNTTNYLYLFWPYLGYVLAGYYIDKRLKIKNNFKNNLILISIIFFLVSINTYLTFNRILSNPNYYLFLDDIRLINISIPTICLFILLKNIALNMKPKIEKIINYCSKTTLLIYLIHVAVRDHTQFISIYLSNHMQINLAMLLYLIIVVLISFIGSIIILKIPIIKKLFT